VKLFYFPVAPNPTRVRLYLAEKEGGGAAIPIEQVLVNLREGEQRRADHLARNPFGKLPVLELDDGSYLLESLAIIEYIEERFPDPPLIGLDPEERARVRELDRIAEIGVLHSIARIVHATNSPLGLPAIPEVAQQARTTLEPALRVLETKLCDGRPFVAGDHPTIADATLQAAFQFGRLGEIEIDPSLEHLARWDRAYRARPAAKNVLVL
jgi:glutathione S-transferase